jgi:hypothetical protein
VSTSTEPFAEAGSVFVGAKVSWNVRVLSAETGLGAMVVICAADTAAISESSMATSVFDFGRNIGVRSSLSLLCLVGCGEYLTVVV